MSFTVYGPGIRDEVLLDNLFENKVLEQPDGVLPSRKNDQEASQADENAKDNIVRSQAKKAYKRTHALPKDREPAIAAHQIMTAPVITLSTNTSIVEAWRIFRDSRFRYMPVMTPQGKLTGIMSDRALLRYAATSGNIPPYPKNSPQAKMTIEAYTKMQVITATPDTRIREIARLLFEKHIGAMPIVDRYDNLVGIITRSDILRTVVNHAPLELWV